MEFSIFEIAQGVWRSSKKGPPTVYEEPFDMGVI